MKHQKVEGREDIVRDKITGAILYKKSEEQVQAIRARKKAQKQKEKDVDQLKAGEAVGRPQDADE